MSAGRLLRRLGLGGALSLLPLSAALAAPHIVDIRWDGGGRFSHQASVPAGKFVEVCGALQPGQSIAWSFQGGGEMDFNIHYHRGKDTVYPVKLAAVRDAAQRLPVQAKEVHCWMWSNRGAAAVPLELRLQVEP